MRIVYAVLGWLGTTAGALCAAVLWGFLKKQSWACFWGAVAATVLLLAGFFPMIGGYPMGIHNVSEVHPSSMYLPAPILRSRPRISSDQDWQS